MLKASEISVQDVLERAEKSAKLDGLELEVWTGGGQPPPYYRSDQFRLLTVDGNDVLQFARPRWDKNFDPPELIEKFQLPATKEDVTRIIRLIIEAQVFTRHYVEELDPRIGDVLKTEIIVKANGKSWERNYYRTLPDPLIPLKNEVDHYIKILLSKGQHSLYHQGKLVPTTRIDEHGIRP